MATEHAVIEVLDDDAVQPGKLERFIFVPFNPTEYTLNKGAQIAEINIPGIDSPIQQFIRGQTEKLTLEFFFDTTHSGMGDDVVDVRDETDQFYQLVKIQPGTHAPPRIEFSWGDLWFKAIVESVQQKFDLFSPAGVPLRATLSMTFREYKTLEEQLKELKLESADHTKLYVVQRGDTLSRIAFREYRNAGLWRPIADRNGITNPRRLVPGSVLIIPALDVFSAPMLEA